MPGSKPASSTDVIICGGGPAGLSAAVWCADLGLSAVLLEAGGETGGQLNKIYAPVRNYPGVSEASGAGLSEVFTRQATGAGVPVLKGISIESFDAEKMAISTADGRIFMGRALVIATGVRRRALNVPGETEHYGRGILESGAKQASEIAGQRAAIIGGGDAAIENAIILSKYARSVVVIHRRDEFTARRELLEAARGRDNVRFLSNTRVERISGADKLDAVTLTGEHSGTVEIDALLIRIGVEPNSERFRSAVETDELGYIKVDGRCRTDHPFIYAAGDVTNSHSPTIASAVGQGATAVKNISENLLATREK